MLPIFLVTLALVVFAFLMFSVRLLFIKNGEFKGTCANNNPMLQKEGVVCGVCGQVSGEPCGEKES